jgi:hypothetical protein
VVAEGSAEIDSRLVGQYSARWTRGQEIAPPLVAGPNGLTLLTLTYDEATDPFYDEEPVGQLG